MRAVATPGRKQERPSHFISNHLSLRAEAPVYEWCILLASLSATTLGIKKIAGKSRTPGAMFGKLAGRLWLEPHDIPRLQSIGDFQCSIGGGDELRAGFLKPGIERRGILLQIKSADNDILNALADLLRRIGKKKNFHAPFAIRTPERDINVVSRAHESDHFDPRRQQR